MKTSDFNYTLPEELIAQKPAEQRDHSRLMVVDRQTGVISHKQFFQVIDYLSPGDCLVINDTRVIPARLVGTHPGSTAQTEILLLKDLGDDRWEAIVFPGKKLREGAQVVFGNGLLTAFITDVLPNGNRIVKMQYQGRFLELLEQVGTMPLPHYIKELLSDKERYQTVYATENGSAAAPTAGFHFTLPLLERIKEKGIDIVHITLHVGLGTFRPVKVEDVTAHVMHKEYYHVSPEAADQINSARARGGRVISVGTTSCRTLETVTGPDRIIRAGEGETGIFIYPGYTFHGIDGLITNFHLPESTLLMLVSAFSSKEIILSAYEQAIAEKYRFFSFGDAMLII